MNSTEAQSTSTPVTWKNYLVEGLKTTSSNIVNTSYNIIKSIEEKSHVYSTALFYAKIFGLLAIFILFIYLSKVFIRKINNSFSGQNNLGNESAGNQYQGKKDYEITKPGKSNDDQDQFKPKSQNSIIIRGRKKRMPEQLNYNDLFSTYNPTSEENYKNNQEDSNIGINLIGLNSSVIQSVPTIESSNPQKDLMVFNQGFSNDCSNLFETSSKPIRNENAKVAEVSESERSNESDSESGSVFSKRLKNDNIYKQTVFLRCLQEQERKNTK